LLTYNRDDCSALLLLTDYLSKIKDTSSRWEDVDFVSTPKRNATELGRQIHDHFETVLKFAHNNYDAKKIKFRREPDEEGKVEKPQNSRKLGYQGQRRVRPKATKTIRISSRGQFCPKDNSQLHQRRKTAKELTSKRLIIDLVLIKGGIKKNNNRIYWRARILPKVFKTLCAERNSSVWR